MPIHLTADNKLDSFGMTVYLSDLPLLVEDRSGSIALLTSIDGKFSDEADAVILHDANKSFLTIYVQKLNLDYWRPYKGEVKISNTHKKT